MGEGQLFLIDVINILPDGVDCYIQAPSLEDSVIISLLSTTKYEYYKSLKLQGVTKEILMNHGSKYAIEEYFQSIEIRFNDKLLFEAYDGVEIGVISKNLELPQWFINKYVKEGMCNFKRMVALKMRVSSCYARFLPSNRSLVSYKK